jgi:predicted anti-sigma-YlaC factor YlaD
MFNMSKRTETRTGCRSYEARLEDAVVEGAAHVEPGSALALHLGQCAACREALDNAVLASRLMRHAGDAAVEPSEAFVTRVMAAIREAGRAGPAAIWRPLELLASRLALVAAVVLLALAVYLREFAPPRGTAASNGQTEIGAGLPEPALPPANEDDVLVSLAEVSDAI